MIKISKKSLLWPPKRVDASVGVFEKFAHFLLHSPSKSQPWIRKEIASFLSKNDRQLRKLRRQARFWSQAWSLPAHHFQSYLRFLPNNLQEKIEKLGAPFFLAHLFIESTAQDLREAMESSGTDVALLHAIHQSLPHDWIFKVCSAHPHWFPILQIPADPKSLLPLSSWISQGLRGLRLSPTTFSEVVDSHFLLKTEIRSLFEQASELHIPVTLACQSTLEGAFQNQKAASFRLENLTDFFNEFQKLPLLLSSMNFHQPELAFQLCEQFDNLYLDTAWQPPEVILQAIQRVGPKKILYASDWPFLGHSMAASRKRFEDCYQACLQNGLLNPQEVQWIESQNAIQLFQLFESSPDVQA